MKLARVLTSIALTAAVLPAYAATYNVTTAITAYQYQPSPDNEFPVTIDVTYTPTAPIATGTWSVDIASTSVSGDLDYEPFTNRIEISFPGFGLLGWYEYDYADSKSLVSGNTGSYDAATRTLTLTNVAMDDVGGYATCTSSGNIGFECPPPGPVETRGEGSITFVLTFDESFRNFAGIGTHAFTHEGGTDITTWSVSGTEVPVPAAAWLFGSAVLGLVAMRRRNG